MTSRPCSAKSATQSAAWKRQSGQWVCTTSKPCATQARQACSSCSDMPARGALPKPKTISGSSRGWHRPARESSAWVPSSRLTVLFHTGPQIGAYTP